MKTKKIVLCSLFVTLITVGSFIRIPIPPVPFTLQAQFAMLAGLLLGGKWGLAAVLIYILMGLVGLPVFTGGGGPAYILQPIFGYLIGFAAAAFAIGKLSHSAAKPSYRRLLAASFVGLIIIYAIGTAYYDFILRFYLGAPMGLWPLILQCCLITAPKDAALCVLVATVGKRMLPLMGNWD